MAITLRPISFFTNLEITKEETAIPARKEDVARLIATELFDKTKNTIANKTIVIILSLLFCKG